MMSEEIPGKIGEYDDNYLIYFSVNNNTQLEQVKNLLKELQLDFDLDDKSSDKRILITYDYFPHGFVINSCKTAVFTSKELFNITRNEMRFNARFKAGTVIRSHEQLTPGDYVVHEYHGIGQFMEIESLKVFGVVGDYIKIKYFAGFIAGIYDVENDWDKFVKEFEDAGGSRYATEYGRLLEIEKNNFESLNK